MWMEISSRVVYGSYVAPAMLYISEAWCLKESVVGIL